MAWESSEWSCFCEGGHRASLNFSFLWNENMMVFDMFIQIAEPTSAQLAPSHAGTICGTNLLVTLTLS